MWHCSVPVNPCKNNGGCDEHAKCIPCKFGRRRCQCDVGYTGNGFECISIGNYNFMKQEAQLSPTNARDALYQLKCWFAVVRITQTDRVSASGALSATATFYSATCMYTHRCSRLNSRTANMRCRGCISILLYDQPC